MFEQKGMHTEPFNTIVPNIENLERGLPAMSGGLKKDGEPEKLQKAFEANSGFFMVLIIIPTAITIRLLATHSSILAIILQVILIFSYFCENFPAKMVDSRQSIIAQTIELVSIPEVIDFQTKSDCEMNMLLPHIV